MDSYIRPFHQDDLDAVVRLSLLAWAPVFRSFEQVLGPEIYSLIWPDWEKSQKEVVETACQAVLCRYSERGFFVSRGGLDRPAC